MLVSLVIHITCITVGSAMVLKLKVLFIQIETVEMFFTRDSLFDCAKRLFPNLVTDHASFKHNIGNGHLLYNSKLDKILEDLEMTGVTHHLRRSLKSVLSKIAKDKVGDYLGGEIGPKTRESRTNVSYQETHLTLIVRIIRLSR